MLIKVNQTLFTYNFNNYPLLNCKKLANDNQKHIKIEFLSKREAYNYKAHLLNARLEFVLSKLKITPAELIKFL